MKIFTFTFLFTFALASASAANLPITPAQKEYLQHGIIAIVHWGINTYSGQEWGDGDPKNVNHFPKTIGETIDPHQWVRAMKAGGIREVIMVSKHHDGFCLWPAANGYSTATLTDWPGFHNYNVPGAVQDACRKEGLAFGVYLSPWDRNHAEWGRGNGKYREFFHAQYQYFFDAFDVSEIWFDGAQGGYGYYGGSREKRSLPTDAKTYYDFAKLRDELSADHPNAVIFNGECSNSVVWAGNEAGYMDENWTYTRQESGGGYYFGAAEVDTPFGGPPGYREGQWFWHPNFAPKSLQTLVNFYFTSVGRGGVLNLGIAPDQQGRIPENEEQRLKEFGDYVRVHNASDLFADATVQTNTTSTGVTLTLTRDGARQFNVVDFGENLDRGQFVTAWKIEVRESGNWRTVASGGRACWRRMARLGEVVSSDAVRITATGDTTPVLERIHVRYVPTVANDATVSYGDSDAQMWHVRDSEGYHVLPTIGNKMSFNLPDELVRYELEVTVTNVDNAVSFSDYPSFLTLTDKDGGAMSLSVTPDGKMLFLTSGSVRTGTQAGTLVGHVHSGNNDAQSLGSWSVGASRAMTLTLRNEGARLALYKDGQLILKTDKNFGGDGQVKTVTIGTNLATLSGTIGRVRYREASGVDIEGVLNAAHLWLDASAADTITTNAQGVVTKWASRNALGKAATAYASACVSSGPTIARAPRSGRRVVDFGAAGSGRDLEFERSSKIRTVLFVGQIEAGTQDAFFLGDHGADNYNFHRGEKGEYFHAWHAPKFADGTYRNGEKVADPHNTPVPEGHALFTLVASGDVAANGICQDRTVAGRNGGKQVSELIVFNGYLSAEERLVLEDRLWEKWCAKFTAVVGEDADFSELAWTPERPAGGFLPTDSLTLTNAAGMATVTLDEDVTVARLSVESEANHDLQILASSAFAFTTNLLFSALDRSRANGRVTVALDIADTLTLSSVRPLKSDALKVVGGTLKVTTIGEGANGQLACDVVMDGEGATLQFSGKEALGWNGDTHPIVLTNGASMKMTHLVKFRRPLVLAGGRLIGVDNGLDNEGRMLDIDTGASISVVAGTENAIGGATAGSTVDSGRLVFRSKTGGATFDIGEGATLHVHSQFGWSGNNCAQFLDEPIVQSGAGRLVTYRAPLQTGAFSLNGGTLSLAGEGRPTTGTITAARGTTVEVGYGDEDQSVTNVIAGAGRIHKVGTGTTTLIPSPTTNNQQPTTSTYTGGTTVRAGILKIGADGALGTGPLIFAGGNLDLNGHAVTTTSVSGKGTVTNTSDRTAYFNGIPVRPGEIIIPTPTPAPTCYFISLAIPARRRAAPRYF